MKELRKILTVLVVAANTLFIFWILFNGINEGFEGTLPEKISYISLMGLLAANSFLLLKRAKANG